MKKILFVTDFSENSKKSFAYALQFAKQYNAEISLVHIYKKPRSYDDPYKEYTVQQEKIEIAAARGRLDEMYESFRSEGDIMSRVSYKLVNEPSPIRGIFDTIEKDQPDVLMLSTIGDNVAPVFVFGTILKQLVRECPIPVLTIPPEAKFRDISKVLFTTNYNMDDLLAMKELIHLLDPVQPEIKMAHVRTYSEVVGGVSGEPFWEKVRAEVDYDKIKYEVMNGKNVYDRLNEYVIAEQPNLLVMTDKDNGVWYDLFHIDLIKRMEFHSSTPVLTFNAIGLSRITEKNTSMANDEQ